MIEELKRIREHPIRLDQGICGNMRTLVGDEVMPRLRALMSQWPKARKCEGYPVEGSVTEYMNSVRQKTLWENPRRIALLDWLIKELENG